MTTQQITPAKAASNVIRWMRTYLDGMTPLVTDLELVRQMLPGTPYGQGVKEIKSPMAATWSGCEGALVRNPRDDSEWAIFYNGTAEWERRRFTIAHELGHFVLHRNRSNSFQCESGSVYSDSEDLVTMEREANRFASDLLMPGDLFGQAINSAKARIDLHFLSNLAEQFDVSFEALCIRFIEYTDQRAILVCWDNGYLDYESRSSKARVTRARVQRLDDPQEPLPGTLAANSDIAQEWKGVEMSAAIWCQEEAPYMKLREFKHSHTQRNRVLSLLLLESAEPRPWDRTWQDEESFDSYDQFISAGQQPIR